jgi:hypothetical protein
MMMRTPFRLAARFKDVFTATCARKTISDSLTAAEKEVSDLFEKKGGIADSSDIYIIYSRYGFRNDCGWRQETPLSQEDSIIYWEIPDGMMVDEAEQLLLAFGALSVHREDIFDDELLRRVPHPAALFLSEIEDIRDFDEDDLCFSESCEKKILH